MKAQESLPAGVSWLIPELSRFAYAPHQTRGLDDGVLLFDFYAQSCSWHIDIEDAYLHAQGKELREQQIDWSSVKQWAVSRVHDPLPIAEVVGLDRRGRVVESLVVIDKEDDTSAVIIRAKHWLNCLGQENLPQYPLRG
jgi:hypothetical protein